MTFARIVGAVGIALFISGCTNQPASDRTPDSETTVTHAQPAGFNAADASFATDMIGHHQQAVELAALVPDRSINPELRALATQISGAQEPEITTLAAFLVQWNENPQDRTDHTEHGGMAMNGMVDTATMAKLKTLTGVEFDTLWLQSMIGHHQGAIEMANAEVVNGRNVDAKKLAQTIIDAQQAEITQMQKMLGSNP